MWVVALIIFIGALILFNNPSNNNSSKRSKRSSYDGGIPYRNRKQIRNFIRKR